MFPKDFKQKSYFKTLNRFHIFRKKKISWNFHSQKIVVKSNGTWRKTGWPTPKSNGDKRRKVVPAGQAIVPSLARTQRTAAPQRDKS